MLKKTNKIYTKPVDVVVKSINDCSYNKVFLLGSEGTGKSVVLKEFSNQNKNLSNPIINGTAMLDKYISIYDRDVANLNQMIQIIKVILNYIKVNISDQYYAFYEFENKLSIISQVIDAIYMFSRYESKYNMLGKELCDTPEVLLEEFLSICTKSLDFETITLVIDNFDTYGASGPSERYQRFIYNLLSKYLRLVMTVSDESVLNDASVIDKLSCENDIVTLEYSKELSTVKEILDTIFISESIEKGNLVRLNRVGLILSDETVLLMIKKTNGNLFDMIRTLRELYRNLDTLDKGECDIFVLNYIDKVINKSPIITGDLKKERILYVK